MPELWFWGGNGQLGSALRDILKTSLILTRNEVDLSKPNDLIQQFELALGGMLPVAVINAAAYTQVDKAESELELSFQVNAESPEILAKWCAERDIPFVHFSTDYVFPGNGTKPRLETDPVGPLNFYGKTKLVGEEAVVRAGGRYLVFRISWIYDAHGKNFLRTMLRLGAEREELTIVSDQAGAPSYAPHVAKAVCQALDSALQMAEFPSGVYHLCHGGEATWYEFASSIFAAAAQRGIPLKVKKVHPILTKDYPTPAHRPLNSRLNTKKAARILQVSLPHWKVGLEDCMKEIKFENRNSLSSLSP